MSIDQHIGRMVHLKMWDQKLTQNEVARRMGITQAALSRKLRGERAWLVEDLYVVAGILGCDPFELLPSEPSGNAAVTREYQRHLRVVPRSTNGPDEASQAI